MIGSQTYACAKGVAVLIFLPLAGGARDYEPRDYGPREPGHGEMTQAFFDARYCGEDADFGDLAYDLSLHRG